jgi:hypothetical protein
MSQLVNDRFIDMMITCPETKFLRMGPKVKALVASKKALVNMEIPAGCKQVVETLNAIWLNISFRDLIRM